MQRTAGVVAMLALVGSLAGCGPRDEAPQVQDTPMTQPDAGVPPTMAPTDPGAAPGALPEGVTQAMVQEGQQLYGNACAVCHGPAGAGTPIAPALNDGQWIRGTGEMEEIVTVIRVGVAQPQQYATPMPPMGGANFTEPQVRSIAAYVYSISRGG